MSIIGFTKRIFKEEPFRFSLAVITLFIGSLIEGIGIALLVPLLQLVGTGNPDDAQGRVAETTASFFNILNIPFTLGSILIFFLFIILLQQSIMLLQQKISFGTQFKFEASLRESVYKAIFNAKWPFFVETKIGHMTNTLATEVARGGAALLVLNAIFTGIMISAVYFAIALFLSWQASLVILLGATIVIIFLSRQTSKGKVLGRRISEANSGFQEEITEQLTAAKLIKGYAAQDSVIKRFRSFYKELAHANYLGNFNSAKIKVLMDSGMTFILVITVYLAVTVFNFEITGLMIFLFVFYRMAPRLSHVQTHIHKLNTLIPALEKVDDLKREALKAVEKNGTIKLGTFSNGLSFKNVSFFYIKEHLVLDNVSLNIEKGKTVAVVGSSGVGKSTLIDLALGLLEPASGEISLDGALLSDYDRVSWANKIGYVAQDTVLFNDTVAANIGWALPNASMEEIVEAAKLAYAHEFIEELPEKYDTIIGARGSKMSGGQRQRLALARALIRKPEFLILDEATSALDAFSEKKIQKAVEDLSSSVTILIVTHRLSTIKNVDYIYVLDKGKIVEEGRWNDLANLEGRFNEQKKLQALE